MAHREDIIAGLIFAAIGVAIPSAAVAQHFFQIDIIAFAGLGFSRGVVGWSFGILAFAIAALNGYLNYIAPKLHERRHGTLTDYAHVSGIPIVGGFFVLFAAVLLPPAPWAGVLLLSIYLADTGGLPWVLAAVLIRR